MGLIVEVNMRKYMTIGSIEPLLASLATGVMIRHVQKEMHVQKEYVAYYIC